MWCFILLATQATIGTNDFFEDTFGLCRPDEGLRVFVVMLDVVIDSLSQFRHAAEYAVSQPRGRDVAKETLHHV